MRRVDKVPTVLPPRVACSPSFVPMRAWKWGYRTSHSLITTMRFAATSKFPSHPPHSLSYTAAVEENPPFFLEPTLLCEQLQSNSPSQTWTGEFQTTGGKLVSQSTTTWHAHENKETEFCQNSWKDYSMRCAILFHIFCLFLSRN